MKLHITAKGYIAIICCLIFSVVVYYSPYLHTQAYKTSIFILPWITEIFLFAYYAIFLSVSMVFGPVYLLFRDTSSEDSYRAIASALVPVLSFLIIFLVPLGITMLVNKNWFIGKTAPKKK